MARDIIDLDRFMRAGVRPPDALTPASSASSSVHDDDGERLVVDAGAGRKPQDGTAGRGRIRAARDSSEERDHYKCYSRDSGLSGDSLARPTRKPRRQKDACDLQSARGNNNTSTSVREFRAVCERVLLDQQEQIARVAQLCERLTEQRVERLVERLVERPPDQPAERCASSDTSDISSSTRSTKDQRRRDKHRTEECKTYKIIMNKLDELNRLFAGRARSPPVRHGTLSGAIDSAHLATSHHKKNEPQRPLTPQVLVERAVGDGSTRGSTVGSARGSARRRVVRAVTQACSLDIAPAGVWADAPNVTVESVIQGAGSRSGSSSGRCDPRCGFDLDDPVHLYAQAKRLQALHATAHRARSLERDPLLAERLGKRLHERRRERSLCAMCRGCWRSLRQYVAAQVFCRPETSN